MILLFPNRDGASEFLIFDDPQERARTAKVMNSIAQGFLERSVKPENVFKCYNYTNGRDGVLKIFDYIAEDCRRYPGAPEIYFVVFTHGSNTTIWTPDKYRGEAEESLRIHALSYEDLRSAIEKIEKVKGQSPIVYACIDACDSDEFLENLFKNWENKPYFGATSLITPYEYAGDDYDKNRIIDYNDLSLATYGKPLENVTYNTPPVELVIGNVRAMKEHFYLPVSSDKNLSAWEPIKRFTPEYNRPHNYPIDYIKAYFGS